MITALLLTTTITLSQADLPPGARDHFERRMELLCGPDTPERRAFEQSLTDISKDGGKLVQTLKDTCPKPPPRAQPTVTIKTWTVGCKDFQRFLRLTVRLGELMQSGDRQAAARLIEQGVASGECHSFSEGDEVYAEGTPPALYAREHPTLRCYRPKGRTDCYWTLLN